MKAVHIFPLYTEGLETSPYIAAMKEAGLHVGVFPRAIDRRYARRWQLLFRIWPQMIFAAFSSGWESLRQRPIPNMMLADTHLQVLAFSILRGLLGRRSVKLVLFGFIYNKSSQPRLEVFRRLYARTVLTQCDAVVCHSKYERDEYALYFSLPTNKIHFISWASTTTDKTSDASSQADLAPYIFSAGRSWRDYATLIKAVEGLPIDLRIACDSLDALPNREYPANVYALRECYGIEYQNELKYCLFCVIPVSAPNVSAGQMVLLDAFFFAKTVITTKTVIAEDYVTHALDGFLTEPKDALGLRNRIVELLENDRLRRQMSIEAKISYETKFTDKAKVRELIKLMEHLEA